MRDEIDDVRSDRHLAPKAKTLETMCTQNVPKRALGVGQIATQALRGAARAAGDLIVRHGQSPPPWPSPARGEGTLQRSQCQATHDDSPPASDGRSSGRKP